MTLAPATLAHELYTRLEAKKRGEVRAVLYTPQGNARAVFDSDDAELLLSGPAGTGKTRANLEYIHQQMLQYPGARCLIIRKTRHSLSQSVLVTFERDVLGEDNPICNTMRPEHRSVYYYPNGSKIVLGGMDKPTKVLSSEYDIIYIPEVIEFSLTEVETLKSRLRSYVIPTQRLLMDTNPDSDQHWLLRRAAEGKLRIVYCQHEDNPMLYNADTGEWTKQGLDYVFGTLENLTGVRYQRLRLGKWVQAEGAVYDGYNPAVHLVDRFDIPERWRRIRAIDFGYTNPFVCQWWAIDPDGRMYLYREIYMSQRTVGKHAVLINELSQGERIEATVADHDAEDRATLAENGIKTTPAEKAISVGIEKVATRLRLAGDGKPRLMVLRDSLVEWDELLGEQAFPTSTTAEFPSYVWPKGQDGKPRKEVPLDLHNHGMDAMRYAVMYTDHDHPPLLTRVHSGNLYKPLKVRDRS